MTAPPQGNRHSVKKVFSAGGGVLGGHSLCHGLPDASSGGDGVLANPPRVSNTIGMNSTPAERQADGWAVRLR